MPLTFEISEKLIESEVLVEEETRVKELSLFIITFSKDFSILRDPIWM
jgi:hypothetical protein